MLRQIIMISVLLVGDIFSTFLKASAHERSFKFCPKGTIYIVGISPERIIITRDKSQGNFFTLGLINQSIERISSERVLITYYHSDNPQEKTLKLSKHMKVIFLEDGDAIPVGACCSIA